MWLPVDGSDAPKIPSGKGKRLIVLHAGNREEGTIWGSIRNGEQGFLELRDRVGWQFYQF
jgi:hypothetical protein